MNTLKLCVLIVLASLMSCQSDPCEAKICNNGGTCIEGTCDCPAGYMGDSCEETIFGIYGGAIIGSDNCASNFVVSNTPVQAPANGERICFPLSDGESCFWYRIDLKQDFSFRTTFNQIAVAPGGTERLVSSSNPGGSFMISGNRISLTFDNGASQEISIEDGNLSWDLSQRSADFPDCIVNVIFEKV